VIPDTALCFQYMDQYGMLENIRRHSIVVARIGEYLVEELAGAMHGLSRELVLAGALLHDIAKTECIKNGCDHARLGGEICHQLGLDEVVAIVDEHVVLKNGISPDVITEKEIVYYADKRVNHETIVGLDERLAYIIDRYGNNDPERETAILRNFDICRLTEAKIFRFLDFEADELAAAVLVRPTPF